MAEHTRTRFISVVANCYYYCYNMPITIITIIIFSWWIVTLSVELSRSRSSLARACVRATLNRESLYSQRRGAGERKDGETTKTGYCRRAGRWGFGWGGLDFRSRSITWCACVLSSLIRKKRSRGCGTVVRCSFVCLTIGWNWEGEAMGAV